MNIWPHDDTASKNAFYGDFQAKNWGNQYLIRIHPPFTMYYEKKTDAFRGACEQGMRNSNDGRPSMIFGQRARTIKNRLISLEHPITAAAIILAGLLGATLEQSFLGLRD